MDCCECMGMVTCGGDGSVDDNVMLLSIDE